MTGSSRYRELPTAEAEVLGPDLERRVVRYYRRRSVPRPEDHQIAAVHEVVSGDRIDRIAADYLGDPEAFWLIADANGALRPAELVDEDRTGQVVIPVPRFP